MFSSILKTVKWAVNYDQPSNSTAAEARELTKKHCPLAAEAKKTSSPDEKIESSINGALKEIKELFKESSKLVKEDFDKDKHIYAELKKLEETLKDELLNQSFYKTADTVKTSVYTVGGLTPKCILNAAAKISTEHPYLIATTTLLPRMIGRIGYSIAKFGHKRAERSLQSLKATILEKTPTSRSVAQLALHGATGYFALDQMRQDPAAPLPYLAILGVLLARGYF